MTWLEELWWREDASAPLPVRALLGLGALGFRAAVAGRAALYDAGVRRAARADAPVISVGNLAVGGAGKTPVAMAIATRLLARGRRPAILSRGHGARRPDPRVVSDGARVLLAEPDAGDEPLLMALRLPGVAVLCGPRRAELAARAVHGLGADALVLDDGFQHRALARDLDVVVVDASSPAGNGHLLPLGPNREPWVALRRAQLAWIARADQAEAAAVDALRARLLALTGRPPVESRHAPRDVLDGTLSRSLGVDALVGRRVVMACGLARPDGFRRTLLELGATIAAERVFGDHHRFTQRELEEVLGAAARGGCEYVAITEKDAVRLTPAVARDPAWRVLRIEAEVTAGGDALEELLAAALARGDARRRGPAAARGREAAG